MGSALERLAHERGLDLDEPVGEPPAEPQSALDQLAAQRARQLSAVGLSRVATPADIAAQPAPPPSSIRPAASDITRARTGPSVGAPPWWLRVPGEIIAAPFESANTVRKGVQYGVLGERRNTPAEEAVSAQYSGRIAPPAEQNEIVTTENAPKAITPREYYGGVAQTGANLLAPVGETALADAIFEQAAKRYGTEAATSVVGKAITHAAAAAPVGGVVNVTYDPEHPVRAFAIGASIAAPLGAAGGAIEGHQLAARQAAQTADANVARAFERGAAQGPRVGGSALDRLAASRGLAPEPAIAPAAVSGVAPTPLPAPTGQPGTPAPLPAPLPVGGTPTLRRRIAETIDPTISEQIRQAEANPVTGLPGRAPFNRALKAAEADPSIAVVRFDVNGTKASNDTHGHPFTDANVLQPAAASLTRAAADAGIPERVFHLSGDEFAALVPADKAPAFVERARSLYGVREHGQGVKTSLSGGFGQTEVEADAAAYAAKRAEKREQGIPDRAEGVMTVPTSSLVLRPQEFQYKLGLNPETGAGPELANVRTFDPELAGVLAVWKDPQTGETVVVNGHNRATLAKRLDVPTMDVRFLTAKTPAEARAKGALINIAEGRGTALDAAKFFRDTHTTPDALAEMGVSLRGSVASKGMALSTLDPALFDRVVRGEIPEETAAAIGKVLDQPEQQRAAVTLIERSGKRLTPAEVENVARQVRDAGSETTTQETLFGTEETALSLAVDRARLAESLKKDLSRDARLFGYVSKEGRAEELARGGNTINTEESARLAQHAAELTELFDRLATRSGPVGDLLTEGARRLAKGEKLATVKEDLTPRLREAVSSALEGGATGRGEHGEGHVPEGAAAPNGGGAAGGAEEGRTPDSIDEAQRGIFGAEPLPASGPRDMPLPEGVRRASSGAFIVPESRLREGAAERLAFPMTALHVAEHAEVKGIPVEQSAAILRRAGYTVTDEMVQQARELASTPRNPGEPFTVEARDLFGNETPDETAQGSLFGESAGTLGSRSLKETEAAARAEIPKLRDVLARTTDPTVRARTAQRLAELERLVNRGEKVTEQEMRTRAEAGEGDLFGAEPAPDADERMSAADQVVRDRGESGEPETAEALAPGTPDEGARDVNPFIDTLRRWFDVTSRSPGAKTTGLIIRARAGERAAMDVRATAALRQFAKTFDKMPDAERLDFIDRIETGQHQRTPVLDAAARMMRSLLDQARDEIRALGTGKLEEFIENYFPHIWENPEDAQKAIARITSKRSLTGPGSFLKRRDIPTIKEGIEAGLVPLTTNPIDLTLLKLREMHRYLMGQRILAEMKGEGLARFVSAFQKAPEGYVAIDDKVGTVYGPPTVTMTEAFDKLVKERLDQIIEGLGIRHTRRAKIGGTRLGYAESTGTKIVTRAGTPLDVVYHELGHAIDFKYGLWDYLTDIPGKTREAIEARKTIHAELRALADLRYEGQEAPASFKHYVRNKYEKMAVSIQALIYAPDKMRAVAPTVMDKLTAFIRARPELRDLLDLKPSLVHGAATHEIPVGGLVVTGRYYAPEPVATVLNNFLSPGLAGNPFYDLYRSIGNGMNQAQLGVSFFHLGFTSVDATVSKTALGLEQLAAGRPLQALSSIARTPIEPIANYLRGSKVLREYTLPGTQGGDFAAVVDALVQGGGRVSMDEFYKAGSSGEFWRALRNAGKAAREGRVLRAGGQTVLAGWKGVGAVLDAVSWPVMQHVVPRQKLGVFADLARFELSRLPENASPELIRATMAKVWDSVDNRMGEIVYDNLLWSRATKDLLMASTRSVGWNVGTVRELGGGTLDLARAPGRLLRGERGGNVLTHRAAYVVALPFVTGLMGGIVHYLYTGTRPETWMDYYFPRTGRTNPDGTEERVQLPSYMRDVFAVTRHPYQTVKNKVHPLVAAIADMLENRDFRGDMIRNPDDPIVKQISQEAEHLAGEFEPFGIANARSELRRGQSLGAVAGTFFGVTPAPREVTRSPAVNRMMDLLARRAPEGATPEEAASRRARAEVRGSVRAGGKETGRVLGRAITSGRLPSGRAVQTLKESAVPTTTANFQRLTLPEALEVYHLASPAERQAWAGVLAQKLQRFDPSHFTPDELERVREGMEALQPSHAAAGAGR